jgi:parallel beta-helix repeat protein
MSGSSFNFLLNNTVSNHTYNGFGIYDSSNNNVIKNNILTKNRYCGINLRISSDNIIIDNNISNNNIGIHIPNTENTIKDNVFSNNNKRLDKELKIPGLEFIGIIIAVVIFYFYHKFTKKLK